MVLEEEHLLEHLRTLHELYQANARLAVSCGLLYSALHQIQHLLGGSLEIDANAALKAKLSDSIAEVLKLVAPMLEQEYLQRPKTD